VYGRPPWLVSGENVTSLPASDGREYEGDHFADKEAVMLSLLEDPLADAIDFAHAPCEEDKPAESIRVTTERYRGVCADRSR
jgi:hypothetical protein